MQRHEPGITLILVNILGHTSFIIGTPAVGTQREIALSDLIANAILGGNNEMLHNFRDFAAVIPAAINKAIGEIEAGKWPPKEPQPVLIINENELPACCIDLLTAPGNYDRAIREATVILENRIRNKCPHETLSRLIPLAADQTGDNIINKLFSPDKAILIISNDRNKRIAFHKILLGINAYLRNPSHHTVDPNTEWSWAWSIIGLIDQLLSEIENCMITTGD